MLGFCAFLNPTFLRVAATAFVVATLWPQVAPAQDMRSLSDRIERLQRDVDVLQRQLARGGSGGGASAPAPVAGGGVSSDYIGRTEDRFSSIDEQLRDLTGRLEQLTHQLSQATQRLDKLVTDVDFRLTALERGGAAAPGAQSGAAETQAPATAGAPPPPASRNLGAAQVPAGGTRMVLVPGAPAMGPGSATEPAAATPGAAVQLPQGTPEAQYEFAYGALLQAQREQSDFGRAEQALRAFINANPQHRLTGNAQYWLGESFYARRDFQNAAATFAEGLQKYPRSEKAPDNMLKLGMSLGQLNRKPEACVTLGELDKRYPQAPAQVKTSAQRERTRLACG